MATARGIHPVFVKHSDMGLDMNHQLREFDLCKELWKVIRREELEGVQRVRGLWRIYINVETARVKLLSEGFSFNGLSIRLYDENPFRQSQEIKDRSIRTTKVIISNLPLSIANEEVETMLVRLGCKLETKAEYEYIRDEGGNLTSIKNGNRFVLVESNYLQNNPLPRNTYCHNWRCNIFHYNQPKHVVKCYNCGKNGHTQRNCQEERGCKVCGMPGHLEGSDECSHYQSNNAYLFAGQKDMLSNFYPCRVPWKGEEFSTVEHAYTYEKAMQHNRSDIAASMLRSNNALEAKKESNKIVTQKKWHDSRNDVMKELIKLKVEHNNEIESELLKTEDRILGEAVFGQDYWGVGLHKREAGNTNPDNWPGENSLGKLYMELRSNLMEKKEKFTKVEGGKRKASNDDLLCTPSASKPRPSGTTPTKEDPLTNNLPSSS